MGAQKFHFSVINIFNASNIFGRLFCAISYCITYELIYTNFTFKVFEYMGVEHLPFGIQSFILFIAMGAIPICFFHGIRSIASGFSFILYIFAYIPILEAIFTTYNMPLSLRWWYGFSIFSLMCLFFLTDNHYIGKKFFYLPRKLLPVKIIYVLTFTVILILLVFNIGNLRFVNIITQRELMYEMRGELAENALPGSGYIIFWLSNAFLPLLLIYSLKKKDKKKYFVIIGAYLLVFMLTMQKSTFILPFLLTIVYYYTQKHPNGIIYYSHSFIIGSLIIISAILYIFQSTNEIAFGIAAVIFYRTMCVSGHLFSMYIHFFENNPYTLYSHINIVNVLTKYYPYDDVLGKIVSGGDMNANATFLITDGIAACGVVGIWIIGLIFIWLKSVLNTIQLKYDKKLILIMFIPGMLSFLNVSLFTSMITGGLLVLYFLLRNSKLPALYNNPK